MVALPRRSLAARSKSAWERNRTLERRPPIRAGDIRKTRADLPGRVSILLLLTRRPSKSYGEHLSVAATRFRALPGLPPTVRKMQYDEKAGTAWQARSTAAGKLWSNS